MKAFLMHPDRDFAFEQPLPANEPALRQDLELDTLLEAMAGGDELLFEVAKRALLLSLTEPEEIVYRQQILTDCLANPAVVRELYTLAGEALAAERSQWGFPFRDSPRSLLSASVSKMEVLVEFLRRLRRLGEVHAGEFRSPGFERFFGMLADELEEPYLREIERQLDALRFKGGVLMSARLGAGNKGTEHILRQPRGQGLLERILDRSGLSFTVPDRDEGGWRALSELEERGLNRVANALAQSVEHVKSLFVMLRIEIGFYVGALNLSRRLAELGQPTCLPALLPADELALSGRELYEPCLALTLGERVVGNDIEADGKSLLIITGANQGGKSTFLRSVGLAQLMAQSGMFVAAQKLRLNACRGLFTHFKREEDDTMQSGKLDEELARMSAIVEHLGPHCVLLCNESFASTNEREGSEIARQVVDALLEERIKVLFVTHMFDFASSFHQRGLADALFLRAQRGADGARPYRLSEGEPLPTSYGEDSYRRIFGQGSIRSAATVPDRRR